MALIKCPECGRQVSDKARACPGCGCPVADETSEDEILNTKSTDAPDSTKIMSSSQNNGSAIKCPKCRSSDWRLASVVYEESVSSINTETVGGGVGIGTGSVGVGVGGATTNGIQQTELSKRLAPPKVHGFGLSFISFFILPCIIMMFVVPKNGWIFLILAGIIFLLAIWQASIDVKKAAPLIEQYKKLHICMRCGTTFIP